MLDGYLDQMKQPSPGYDTAALTPREKGPYPSSEKEQLERFM